MRKKKSNNVYLTYFILFILTKRSLVAVQKAIVYFQFQQITSRILTLRITEPIRNIYRPPQDTCHKHCPKQPVRWSESAIWNGPNQAETWSESASDIDRISHGTSQSGTQLNSKRNIHSRKLCHFLTNTFLPNERIFPPL